VAFWLLQQPGLTLVSAVYDWLIVDVIFDEPRTFDPLNVQICDPGRPTTCVSGGPGRRRAEFMAPPGEGIDQLNDEASKWRLLEPWGASPNAPASSVTPSTGSRPAGCTMPLPASSRPSCRRPGPHEGSVP
jgi:hypothetical protein